MNKMCILNFTDVSKSVVYIDGSPIDKDYFMKIISQVLEHRACKFKIFCLKNKKVIIGKDFISSIGSVAKPIL